MGYTASSSCVLSTGQKVICGREAAGAEWKLHFCNKNDAVTSHEGRRICEHGKNDFSPYKFLPIIIFNKEYVVVSCYGCDKILINVDDLNNEPLVAYQGNGREIGPTCLQEAGTLCVVGQFNGAVSFLNCTRTEFTLKRTLPEINNLWADDICYIRDHDMMVLSSWYHNRVCAVRNSGNFVWNKVRSTAGNTWKPSALAFLPNNDVLLVGDSSEAKICIVSPKTGNPLQTVDLLHKAAGINDLHLVGDRLLVHSGRKLSYYSVRIFLLK